MELTITHFLIVCPLVFAAGLIDAIAGGGGLISLPAYIISGLPAHFAIGTNKMSSSMGTAIATWKFAKNGYIVWKPALICSACALLASATGARLGLLLDDAVFKKLLLVILPLTAFYIFRCKSLETDQEPLPQRKMLLFSIGITFVIGVYDGFYGPGTGTLLLLLLTSVAHMKIKEANGIAKAINLTTNISSLSVLLLYGKVILPLGLTAGLFSIAGNYIGTRFFDRGGAKLVRPVILLVLVIFFIKVLTEVI